MVSTCLDPKEVAAALGIDRDALEHWIREGWLPTHDARTGDNRIDLAQAIRFIRHYHLTVRKPDALGLRATDPSESLQAERREVRKTAELTDTDVLTHLMISRYATGAHFADYLDRVITPLVPPRQSGAVATDRLVTALRELTELLVPSEPHAPIALCASIEGVLDPLPSAMAAVVLTDKEYRVQDLGPDTTTVAVARAATEKQARVIYLHVGPTVRLASILRDQLAYLASQLRPGNKPDSPRLLVGGGATEKHPDILPPDAVATPDMRRLEAQFQREADTH